MHVTHHQYCCVCLDLAKMILHSFPNLARTLRAQGNPARRADWGLVPFAAAELLARVAAAAGSGRSYLITLSAVELYGEHLRDLLAGPGTPFHHPYVPALQQRCERPALFCLSGKTHTNAGYSCPGRGFFRQQLFCRRSMLVKKPK